MNIAIKLFLVAVFIVTPNYFTDIPEPREIIKEEIIEKINNEKKVSKKRGYISEITAYCACSICTGKNPGDSKYGITSIGRRATEKRTVAVGRNFLPINTKIKIDLPEFKGVVFIVEDSFGRVDKGTRIDVFFENHQDALAFGRRRNVQIWVVE